MRWTEAIRCLVRIPTLMVIAAACGCVSDTQREIPSRPTVTAGEFGTPDCFLRRTLQDFEVLDDRNLIVFAPGKSEAYHVQISPPATELRFATLLAFESRSSRVCGYAGDGLMLGDSGPGVRRFSITGVYRLDAMALEGLTARFGKGTKAMLATPIPGAGAAIERDLEAETEQ